MDGATIAMFVFQTVITAIIGVAAWGVKNAIGEMKAAVSELKAADKKNAEEIAAVRGELGDLKADLPLIYTTREDFIRVSNNIDQKLDKLLYPDMDIHPSQLGPGHLRRRHQPRGQEHRLHVHLHRRRRGRGRRHSRREAQRRDPPHPQQRPEGRAALHLHHFGKALRAGAQYGQQSRH